MTRTLTILCLSVAQILSSFADTIHSSEYKGQTFNVSLIAEGLGIPWGMCFVSPTTLLITQRHGEALLIDVNSGQTQTIKGLPKVLPEGQGGLLDVAKNPYSPKDNWLYFTYSKPGAKEGMTTLARATLKQNTLTNWEDLLVTNSATNTNRHYGSRITFDDQGHLYFTVGDRGVRENAQNLNNHAGTVIRLNLDGSTPSDNPFIGQPNRLKEIWSYGHRNPQGIAFDHINQRLWLIEHGPRGGDELNLITKGKNYGWPVISYGKEYWAPIAVGESTHKKGMEQPKKYYVPSIAPGSLLFYSGAAFPSWKNQLFIGALKLTHLNVLELDNNGKVLGETRLLESLNQRIRSLAQSDEGLIYLGTDSGHLLRISPLIQHR